MTANGAAGSSKHTDNYGESSAYSSHLVISSRTRVCSSCAPDISVGIRRGIRSLARFAGRCARPDADSARPRRHARFPRDRLRALPFASNKRRGSACPP